MNTATYPVAINGRLVCEVTDWVGAGKLIPTDIEAGGKQRIIKTDPYEGLDELDHDSPQKWVGRIASNGEPDINRIELLGFERDPDYGILHHTAVIYYDGRIYRLDNE
jgi:hypothetical protein